MTSHLLGAGSGFSFVVPRSVSPSISSKTFAILRGRHDCVSDGMQRVRRKGALADVQLAAGASAALVETRLERASRPRRGLCPADTEVCLAPSNLALRDLLPASLSLSCLPLLALADSQTLALCLALVSTQAHCSCCARSLPSCSDTCLSRQRVYQPLPHRLPAPSHAPLTAAHASRSSAPQSRTARAPCPCS